jgi:PAS domain-containing protein
LPTTDISTALDDWREAERRWETTDPDGKAYRAAAIEVIAAWLRYQELTRRELDSFVLVADDAHTFVAVGGGVKAALDYEPPDLLGRRIEDIAAADLRAGTGATWDRFLVDGRQDGDYRLLARDGREVAMRYQARAHYPIPGFHTSRLWPATE